MPPRGPRDSVSRQSTGPRPSPEVAEYKRKSAERVAGYKSRSITAMLDTIGQRMADLFVRDEYAELHRLSVDYEILTQVMARGGEISDIIAHFVRDSREVVLWRHMAEHRLKQIRPSPEGAKEC